MIVYKLHRNNLLRIGQRQFWCFANKSIIALLHELRDLIWLAIYIEETADLNRFNREEANVGYLDFDL